MIDRVPFLDLRAPYLELKEEIDAAFERVLTSGWFLLGEELTQFEAEFAAYVGAKHCVGVANGLDALTLSLRALGVGARDEVIVPAHTFIASWLAVTFAGATLVPVDVDAQTYNMDPSLVESAITPRTRAIMPVHLYGQPADMLTLRAIADRRGVAVLEDAAQAHGAQIAGRRVGSVGTSAWSFYPGKNLGALGDGGAVTTDDDRVAAQLRKLRNYGSSRKYVHEVPGVNSRLDELQAAVLRVKLRSLDEWNGRRTAIAARYAAELPASTFGLPPVPPFAIPSWHLYVIRAPNRDQLKQQLEAIGIDCIVHYPVAPYLQKAYADLGILQGTFPVAEALQHEVLSLPIGPHMSDSQVSRVIAGVQSLASPHPALLR